MKEQCSFEIERLFELCQNTPPIQTFNKFPDITPFMLNDSLLSSARLSEDEQLQVMQRIFEQMKTRTKVVHYYDRLGEPIHFERNPKVEEKLRLEAQKRLRNL